MSDINSDFSALDHAAIQFAEEDRISAQAAQEIPARRGTDAILEWLRAACLACAKAGAEASKATSQARPSSPSESSGIETYPLPDGAVLHVDPRRDLPVVALRAAFLGGQLAEEQSSAGRSSFLASMWSRGTRALDATEFAEAVEDLASDVSGFSGRSSLGFTLETTSQNLAPSLDLLRDVMLEPRFAASELERERRETLAAIDRREDQLAQRAFQLFARTEFATHPYRLPMLGERTSVEAFSAEGIRAQHDRLVRAPNLVIAAAGDVDGERLADDLPPKYRAKSQILTVTTVDALLDGFELQ